MKRNWIILGAVSGAIAVVLGAFGAHGLRTTLDDTGLEVWRTAVRYQMFHAVALLVVGVLERAGASAPRPRALALAGWALSVGTVLFSGSLYCLALGGPSLLGPLTPLGGAAFVLGWGALALAGRGERSGWRGGGGPAPPR
ncbi:MAG: hypothetical protein CMJ84_10255 [Planctomycetes bacterium]|jgi:uncharacterized membrane protein YgdD (TMEM256/DUF423 family)|nr:hypothetical protein [Planctomycetota bacterium]MDP6408771.1 DUF423 domain-containing protein [Planctomycetota bacterium]